MATPVFQINGSTTFNGVSASWQRVVKRQNDDGTIIYQNYALHTWDIPTAEMDSYLSLLAQAGKRLTSLATTDIDDRNEAATYTSAEVGIVNCQQVGRRAVGIRAEFRVDVS